MSADATKLAALAAQATLFRVARRDGQQMKCIAADSQIPESTLGSYANEHHEMGLAALRRLIETRALPLQLLSLLLPDGVALTEVSAAGVDHAALAAGAADYAASHARAVHPDSEAGREIGQQERVALANAWQRLRAVNGEEMN